MGIKMTEYSNYSIQNFFSDNFFLPQREYAELNNAEYYSIWDNYPVFVPSFIPQFNIFDLSFNNFTFPNINFLPPLFDFSIFNRQQSPTLPQQIELNVNQNENILEPTDSDVDAAKIEITKPTETKAKTKKADESLKSSLYIAEEIVPGYFVQKGKNININKLKPYMKDALVKMDKKAKELGYTMVVVDGFRSHAVQAAAKKRKPKLCAPAGKSAHEYGVAVDVALFKNGKQVDIYKHVPEFGYYAQSLGLEWGAAWKSKYEPWHFNFKDWKELADVRHEYRSWNHLA